VAQQLAYPVASLHVAEFMSQNMPQHLFGAMQRLSADTLQVAWRKLGLRVSNDYFHSDV
jgi:hypothetical protein